MVGSKVLAVLLEWWKKHNVKAAAALVCEK
jgi:hypothetical protein